MVGNMLFGSDVGVYRKIQWVHIGTCEYPFWSMLLRDMLPALQLDDPDNNVGKVTFELGSLQLKPGTF